jgi:hypothetical protein
MLSLNKRRVMAQTVIGIFESNIAAYRGVDNLVSNNFNRDYINISVPEESRGRGDVSDEKNTLYSKMGKYFSKVLGDNNEALKYAAVAQQGVVVSVQTDTYAEAEKAAAILDEAGALNVDERASILEDSMTREDRLTGKNTPESPEGWKGTASSVDSRPDLPSGSRPQVNPRSRIIERPAGNSREVWNEQVW